MLEKAAHGSLELELGRAQGRGAHGPLPAGHVWRASPSACELEDEGKMMGRLRHGVGSIAGNFEPSGDER